MLHIATYTEVC